MQRDGPGAMLDVYGGQGHVEPVTDHAVPWGTHRQGGFTDPFGHRWSVGDPSPLQPFPR